MTSRAVRLVKTLFWPAAGETPPSSSTARSSVKQLREVDGIVTGTMCLSVLAREGNKKGLRTRRDTHGVRVGGEINGGTVGEAARG